ncbi:DUF5667 domain-containing protein [Saccharomonospora sp.]|uniref:DUF5667 domain-containing protein n=1 Tax=Saccharomonospora sp. TaxID=33913 RepID=UPI00261F6AF5|nr:DUF5667 domain-containing protein [Saccharomonospora sp.]
MSRAAWFRTHRRDDERFARAVDSGVDSDSFDAELAVVAALRKLGDSVTVDDRSRERIAQRLTASAQPSRARPRTRTRTASVPAIAFSVLSVLLALTGWGTSLAQDALPGEPLYHLKLAQETVTLGLTFDAEDDAVRRLSYASRRLDEMTTLGRHGAHDADYHLALREFTEHATEGTSRLTALATRSDGKLLSVLSSWAQRESSRLGELDHALPATVNDDLDTLLRRIEHRTTALSERMDCYEITSTRTDDLGSLPATGRCAAPPSLSPHIEEPRTQGPPTRTERKERTEHTRHGVPPAPEPPQVTVVDLPHTTRELTDPERPEGSIHPADVAPPPAVSAPVPAPTQAHMPDSPPEEPALVSIAPLLPGLPTVTIG